MNNETENKYYRLVSVFLIQALLSIYISLMHITKNENIVYYKNYIFSISSVAILNSAMIIATLWTITRMFRYYLIEKQSLKFQQDLDHQARNQAEIDSLKRQIKEQERLMSLFSTVNEINNVPVIMSKFKHELEERARQLEEKGWKRGPVFSILSNFKTQALDLDIDFNIDIRATLDKVPLTDEELALVFADILGKAFDQAVELLEPAKISFTIEATRNTYIFTISSYKKIDLSEMTKENLDALNAKITVEKDYLKFILPQLNKKKKPIFYKIEGGIDG